MAKRGATTDPPAAPPAMNSLAEALRARGVHVGQPPPAAVQPEVAPPTLRGKLVVRRERKGHGGKTVTVVEGLTLSPSDLEEIARRMRKALGCGSWVDAKRVMLQGDLAPGAAAWLLANGATRVVQGN